MLSSDKQSIHHHFEFTGKAGEFFRIWIVNILLTILTLGIYSAWAKVRTNQYFYSSTKVAGSAFSYLAEPLTILKGRLLGIAFLIAFSLASQFNPLLYLGMMIVLIAAFPWIVVKSLAFNARVSAWRNVRFKFEGSYWGIVKMFMLLPLVTFLTFGLALPWVIKKQKAYLVNQHSFGGEPFVGEFKARAFYGLYLKAMGLMVIALLTFMVPFVGPLLGMVFYALAIAQVVAGQANIIYGNTTLENYSFECRQTARSLGFIYATNVLAIVFSLGLAIPWAMIRLARYRAECMTLLADEALDGFTDHAQETQSAIGEELGEVFDIAVGI